LIAFELLDGELDIFARLAQPEFVKRVIRTATERGILVNHEVVPQATPARSVVSDEDSESDDYDSFDGEGEDDDRHSRFTTRWTGSESSRLIEVLQEHLSSWKTVAKRMPGRSAHQCRLQYKRLKRLGKIDFDDPLHLDTSEAAMNKKKLTEAINGVVAIHFSFKEQS
jgi:hypothetical protein